VAAGGVGGVLLLAVEQAESAVEAQVIGRVVKGTFEDGDAALFGRVRLVELGLAEGGGDDLLDLGLVTLRWQVGFAFGAELLEGLRLVFRRGSLADGRGR